MTFRSTWSEADVAALVDAYNARPRGQSAAGFARGWAARTGRTPKAVARKLETLRERVRRADAPRCAHCGRCPWCGRAPHGTNPHDPRWEPLPTGPAQ